MVPLISTDVTIYVATLKGIGEIRIFLMNISGLGAVSYPLEYGINIFVERELEKN